MIDQRSSTSPQHLLLMNAALCESIERKTQHIADVYKERDQIISLMLKLAALLGWKTGINTTRAFGDITHVVLVDLPSGQVSWSIPKEELYLYEDLPLWGGTIEEITPGERTWRVMHPFHDPLEDDRARHPSTGLPPGECLILPEIHTRDGGKTDPLRSDASTLKVENYHA